MALLSIFKRWKETIADKNGNHIPIARWTRSEMVDRENGKTVEQSLIDTEELIDSLSSTISQVSDVMTAATASTAGKAGLVPAPAAGAQTKYLRGDGTWQTPNTILGTSDSGIIGGMWLE